MENSYKNQNILSALSYFSVFFAPIVLPILVWILSEKPTSTHGRKALFNHIYIYFFIFLINVCYIFSREVFEKPFDNPYLISNVSLGIGVVLMVVVFAIFLLNIIRGIKLLTN